MKQSESLAPCAPFVAARRADSLIMPSGYEFLWTTAGEFSKEAIAWRDLAENAIEPNPVYGANFLVATEKNLRGGRPIRLLIARNKETDALAALAPIEELGWRNGFPGRAYQMFLNSYVTLTHPLIRSDDAVSILTEMLRFLATAGVERNTLHFPFLTRHRGFYATLSEVMLREGLDISIVNSLSRPAVEPEAGASGERYAKQYVSKSRRSNNERRLRRLREAGSIEFESVFVCEPGGSDALQAFLALEHVSWKGKAGTALLSHESTREFANAAFSGANQAPRVRIRSLTFDKRPIAIALDLESQGVAYAFKAAYDPAFAHFSPGLMLDAHTASRIGEEYEIKRLDSFAQTEVAQAAIWRQTEPVVNAVLSLTPRERSARTLARRLQVAAAARSLAKRQARRGQEIITGGVSRVGGERRAIMMLLFVAGLPALSILLKNLL